jgi:hypothetical protein
MSKLDMDKQKKIVINKVEYIVAPDKEQNVNGYFVLFDRNGEKVFLDKRTTKLKKVIPPTSPDFPPPPLPLPLSQDKQKEENILEAPEKTPIMEKDIDDEEELARHEKELETKNASQKNSPSFLLQKMIKEYFDSNPSKKLPGINNELEVRFNTIPLRGNKKIQRLTKQDYDNVIQYLKSIGFRSENDSGDYSLRMQNEYRDRNTGLYKQSNIRTEIYGLEAIQYYCENDMRPDVLDKINEMNRNALKFTKKNFKMVNNERLYPVNFDDFHFRVSYQIEEVGDGTDRKYEFLRTSWKGYKKSFRYLNRVTFTHPDYPVNVDISIVKSGVKDSVTNKYKMVESISESGVLTKEADASYEVEIEMDNSKIGSYSNYLGLLETFKKSIKTVLSGLQGTNFPVSYIEQDDAIQNYMALLQQKNRRDKDFHYYHTIYSNKFIGPSSYTLQMKNIVPLNENINVPNIRDNFTVTDKADGERMLLLINDDGKIYMINNNMKVIFTGAVTDNQELFHTLLDGEHITHNKKGDYINLYAAFDIYYLNRQDIRSLPFIHNAKTKTHMMALQKMTKKQMEELKQNRYAILKNVLEKLQPFSVVDMNKKSKISPMRFQTKSFYWVDAENASIFDSCKKILKNAQDGLFEYNTDGLIFTHAIFGVGAEKAGESGPDKKITWKYSFKWKPPKYNTIDFLVKTIKDKNGLDKVNTIFEEGMDLTDTNPIKEYKTLQLCCSFNSKTDGYLNPCQNIIDGELTEYVAEEDKIGNDVEPKQFYPTDPYDANAGISNTMLRTDENNIGQLFTEEDEVFYNNTIVEFSYDLSRKEGWRWVPLRVRYDKTAQLLQYGNNFGNAYHVANSNWQSIHNPITEEIITTGQGIPDSVLDSDVYYNVDSVDTRENRKVSLFGSLRNFHNLYVKKKLIVGVSHKNYKDTLIDYACGKGGDISKWIEAKLDFVFGIDISKDNLENRLNGACARYLNARKENKRVPYALFVNGNSAYRIRDEMGGLGEGNAMLSDKALQITKAVFGSVTKKDAEKIGVGVAKEYGKGRDGFNISSCQFALHYFMESMSSLKGFMRNLAECTALEGYFIATAYDGETIFKLLNKKKTGESVRIDEKYLNGERGAKLWEVIKEYTKNVFPEDASSLGYKINVYQESINQLIPEYLIHFGYLDRVMNNYGFRLVSDEEAKKIGLPSGTGTFDKLFDNMKNEITRFKTTQYGNAGDMTADERFVSFLNRYVVYKKERNVNPDTVKLEDEQDIQLEEAVNAVEAAAPSKKLKKINKKLVLTGGLSL